MDFNNGFSFLGGFGTCRGLNVKGFSVLWNKEAYGTLSHFSPGCTNVGYNFVSIPQHYAIKNIQDFLSGK